MHFVINVFVAGVCFISLILFKEIFNKVMKVLLSVVGCGTLSYALSILVKKCGEWFGCWSGDAKYIKGNFLWILPIVLVIYIIICFIIAKKINLQIKLYFLYLQLFLLSYLRLHYSNLRYVPILLKLNIYLFFHFLYCFYIIFVFVLYLLSIDP